MTHLLLNLRKYGHPRTRSHFRARLRNMNLQLPRVVLHINTNMSLHVHSRQAATRLPQHRHSIHHTGQSQQSILRKVDPLGTPDTPDDHLRCLFRIRRSYNLRVTLRTLLDRPYHTHIHQARVMGRNLFHYKEVQGLRSRL
jgi:hypothetical protein